MSVTSGQDNDDAPEDLDAGDSPEGRGGRDRDRGGPGGKSPDVAELLRFLAQNLVDQPDDVHVVFVEERNANVYELEVADEDLGKVIGRGGKTARALRAIVQSSAPRSRKRTMVEILE
jgi:uncharacterized protein